MHIPYKPQNKQTNKSKKADRGRSSKQSALEMADQKHPPHIKVEKDGSKRIAIVKSLFSSADVTFQDKITQ